MKADVVLAPYEALSQDNGLLTGIMWSLVVVDERKRVRSALLKAHATIRELEARHRLLLPHGLPAQVRIPPSCTSTRRGVASHGCLAGVPFRVATSSGCHCMLGSHLPRLSVIEGKSCASLWRCCLSEGSACLLCGDRLSSQSRIQAVSCR